MISRVDNWVVSKGGQWVAPSVDMMVVTKDFLLAKHLVALLVDKKAGHLVAQRVERWDEQTVESWDDSKVELRVGWLVDHLVVKWVVQMAFQWVEDSVV